MHTTVEEVGFQEGTGSEKTKEVKRGGDVSEGIPSCSQKRDATLNTCEFLSTLYTRSSNIREKNQQSQSGDTPSNSGEGAQTSHFL